MGAPVLATGGADGVARIWRFGPGGAKLVQSVSHASRDQIYGCEWSASEDDAWLLTAAADEVVLWDVSAGQAKVSYRTSSSGTSEGETVDVFDAQISETTHLVACAVSDGTVRVHDLRGGDVATIRPSNRGKVTAVRWRPSDGARLAAATVSGDVVLYDTRTWRLHAARPKPPTHVPAYGVRWLSESGAAQDDDVLLSWSNDGTLDFWHAQTHADPIALRLRGSEENGEDTGSADVRLDFPLFHCSLARNPASSTLVAVGGDGGHDFRPDRAVARFDLPHAIALDI
mmetsp:Transcript_23058/g.74193  ORF Transcript_23058/g.74193 Transcript_23058/m.74193 type:complete len:286 (+) Transcript_23058:433-1290(+)